MMVDKEVKCFVWEKRFVRRVRRAGGTVRYFVPKPKRVHSADYFSTTIYLAEFSTSWWLVTLGVWGDFVMKVGKDAGEESFDVVRSCLDEFITRVVSFSWRGNVDEVWRVLYSLVREASESVPRVLLDALELEVMAR